MIDPDEYFTFEEAVTLVVNELGWSRKRATKELLKAINAGEIPIQRTEQPPPNAAITPNT